MYDADEADIGNSGDAEVSGRPPQREFVVVSAEMETASSDNNSAAKYGHAGCTASSSSASSYSSKDTPMLPGNLPLQPADVDGRKKRRSSCRPTFVVPATEDGDDDDDCAFQNELAGNSEGGEGKRPNGDVPGRRRHSVQYK